jgi:hypothetical protein
VQGLPKYASMRLTGVQATAWCKFIRYRLYRRLLITISARLSRRNQER